MQESYCLWYFVCLGCNGICLKGLLICWPVEWGGLPSTAVESSGMLFLRSYVGHLARVKQ
jgi:hypothetical protein